MPPDGNELGKQPFEGLDVSDVWQGADRNPERLLYWKKQYATALAGDWKCHVNRKDGDEFYDLSKDPNETTNLLAEHPEKAASLCGRRLFRWLEGIRAGGGKKWHLQNATKAKERRRLAAYGG